jgi:hypothetical protein
MTENAEMIKKLIEEGLIEEEMRIEVYPMIAVPEKNNGKILKKLNITDKQFWDNIKEYQKSKENNNVFGFYGIKGKTASEIKIVISGGEVDFLLR